MPGQLRVNIGGTWRDVNAPGPTGPVGADGANGPMGSRGPGVPPDGIATERLAKVGIEDYDMRWRPSLMVPGARYGATSTPGVAVTIVEWSFPDALIGRSVQFVWQAWSVTTSPNVQVEFKLHNPARDFAHTTSEKIDNLGGGNTLRVLVYVGSLESSAATPYTLTMNAKTGALPDGVTTDPNRWDNQAFALVF
jgi:hypothetical protein